MDICLFVEVIAVFTDVVQLNIKNLLSLPISKF